MSVIGKKGVLIFWQSQLLALTRILRWKLFLIPIGDPLRIVLLVVTGDKL